MLGQLDRTHMKESFLVQQTSPKTHHAPPDNANTKNTTHDFKLENSLWEKAQSIAEWVCSRESTYRSALDLVGWELPTMIAAATRNIYSFAEASLMAAVGFSMVLGAPEITRLSAKVLANFILEKDEQRDLEHLLLFELNDLDSAETVKKAIERIKLEEPEDCSFLAELHQNKPEAVKRYQNKAQNIFDFFSNLEIDESKRERIKKLKKTVILGESAIEGPAWGGLYFMIRLFRKYILKQDRFTGTKGYSNSDEAKRTGDDTEITMLQKIGSLAAMVSAPIANYFLLNKIDDPKNIPKGSWLEIIKSNWDMTHGVFPKLGLLFSYIQIPSTIGQFFTAQGKNELFENIMQQFTMVPSWWFGHQLTNGNLAKLADKKLSAKFGVDRGILVEQKDLEKALPEPAKIQHILKKVKDNPELKKEARKEHAKALYTGFGLHAALVFAARMLMNYVTKLRVMNQLGSKN